MPPRHVPAFHRWVVVAALALAAFTKARAGEVPAAGNHGVVVPEVCTLEDCVRVARQQSPEALIALRGLDVARAGVTTAKAGFLPTAGVTGTYLRRESGFATGAAGDVNRRPEDYNVTGRVVQSVFNSGRVRASVDIAKRSLTIADLTYRTSLETVTLATRLAFLQVLLAEGNVGVREQSVALLRQQLREEEGRFQSGQSSQLNVGRVQVNLANEQPSLLLSRQEVATAYLALASAMGVRLEPGAERPPFRIRGSLETQPHAPSLETCLVRAENQRPELATRRLEIANANRQITVEKAATRPRLDVLAGYDVLSETSRLNTGSDYYSGYIVGVQGSWQLFDGFATLGRVRAARVRVLNAAESLRQERLTVQTEVRTAYEGLRLAQQTLRSQGGNINVARETLGLIGQNVNVGLSSQLEQLQSRLDLTRAQTTRLGALYNYRVALSRLERAMGETAPADLVIADPGHGTTTTTTK